MDQAGIELTTSRLRQLHQLPVVQHVRFTPLKSRQKRNSNDVPVAALDNWQHTYIHTYVRTYVSTYIHTYMFVVGFRCSGTGKRYSNLKETSCLPLLNTGFEPIRVSYTKSSADWMPADKPTELSRIKLKTWTRQPVPMISKHSAHSTPQPFGFRTWLWRYTCLLLLILMLWHRQAIFESKETSCFPLLNAGFEPKVSDTYSPANWMPADKPTELSRIKLKTYRWFGL